MKSYLILWKIIIYQIIYLFSFIYAKELQVLLVSDGFHKPIFLTSSTNGQDILFVVEQYGVIYKIINGVVMSVPLLDIKDRVHQPIMPGDERGLLGMALHPQFTDNGRFFVNYVNRDGNTIISSFIVDRVNELAIDVNEEIILNIKQPYANHNGGQLAFGPDGYLYIGLGDGGYAGDPQYNGQNLETLLGKILRVDIDSSTPYSIPLGNPFQSTATSRKEIWCYGLRNPWRFSFDRKNGDLYIGDVGQNQWEEIDYVEYIKSSGANFGWNRMEGKHCFQPNENCQKDNLLLPVFEYPNNANYLKTLIGWEQFNAKGCSVTGGYVYRGQKIPNLTGHYLFGDYCTGKIWSFIVKNGKAEEYTTWEIKGLKEELYLSSFGEDGFGELYLVNHKGSIYKIADIE